MNARISAAASYGGTPSGAVPLERTSKRAADSAEKPDSDADRAWALVLGAAAAARTLAAGDGSAFGLGADGRLAPAPRRAASIVRERGAWVPAGRWSDAAAALLDLYLPACTASAASPLAIGHLGQSLDGQIATAAGDSYYVTGPDNIVHLHRMRALADAVVVGAGTVAADDPELTTRHVPGTSPVRVVIDPSRKLEHARRIFTDQGAPTLVACRDDVAATGGTGRGGAEGSVTLIGLPSANGALDLRALLDALRARGLYSVFVEGGGVTVSAFLEAGLLDRVQIAIAPLVTGQGRPGLRLPGRASLRDGLRPRHRVFTMGGDVLFDCDLNAAPLDDGPVGVLRRVL
jgi:riboflavin-specific deaminase-like protein